MPKRILFRTLAVFVLMGGVIALVFPFANLFLPGGPKLVLDTRAYFKTDNSEQIPLADNVRCWAETYGTRGRHGNGPMRMWNCEISYDANPLTAAPEKIEDTDLKAMGLLYAPIGKISGSSAEVISRQLPFDRSGDIPQLRLMSAEGEPLVYGVVWGTKELLIRWLMWALLSLLFLAFAAASLYAAKVGWQRGKS